MVLFTFYPYHYNYKQGDLNLQIQKTKGSIKMKKFTRKCMVILLTGVLLFGTTKSFSDYFTNLVFGVNTYSDYNKDKLHD